MSDDKKKEFIKILTSYGMREIQWEDVLQWIDANFMEKDKNNSKEKCPDCRTPSGYQHSEKCLYKYVDTTEIRESDQAMYGQS